MHKPSAVPALVLILILFVPAGYFIAKRMFRSSFGIHLKTMQVNIEEMEKEK